MNREAQFQFLCEAIELVQAQFRKGGRPFGASARYQRVAELGSLIWLETVKRAVLLRCGNCFFHSVGFTAAELKSEAGTLLVTVVPC